MPSRATKQGGGSLDQVWVLLGKSMNDWRQMSTWSRHEFLCEKSLFAVFSCPNSDISWCAQHVLSTPCPNAKVYIGIKGITVVGRQYWSRMEIPSYIWSRGLFLVRSFSRLTWRYPLRPNMLYRILIARHTWPGSKIFWMLSATYSFNCYCEL